ncbi:ADP-ribosylation factor-like protein 2-binding protein isoform X2 [Varanus komodoensis]|uniref:ADP-ribosylation factor-like protein 2-binding protein isoform X2 n=1 Tax=Varanus komodoensis TaxID=61221 RepID=UPI001CF7D6BB|nr:ADP-ribosylation factor-like protein 2-binding protein isoform X2 [Varanus komodoensis]
METLEEENFGVSISSPSDAEFDAVVGYLEDIIMDDGFQLIQRNFMDKYYQEFDDTEENKLIYTPIFNEYICLVEKYIEEKLLDRMPRFSMSTFISSLQTFLLLSRPCARSCPTLRRARVYSAAKAQLKSGPQRWSLLLAAAHESRHWNCTASLQSP